MASKKAMIFGIHGQDGSFMCDLLESKGYDIYEGDPYLISNLMPDEIYNFAGISNVINPFENVGKLMQVNARLPLHILEVIAKTGKPIKFFQASSCLMFGRDRSEYQNEQTAMNPIYPYGAAKLYAHNMVREYRECYGIYAVSGILFPHISERMKDHFFAKKIVMAAVRKEKIEVGRLDVYRDFGYAPEYVEAAYLMMQADKPKDYVIGTGSKIPLLGFTRLVFEMCNLNYEDYITSKDHDRVECETMCADITAIHDDLGWYPKKDIGEIIEIMIKNEHDRTV